jgi:hypothetical protein
MRPLQYNYIIGATSLWLSIPAIVGIKSCNTFQCNYLTLILLFNTCICMTVSTIMWSNYNKKSVIYMLDLTFATIQFILLNTLNIITNAVNYYVQIIISSLILLSYFVTDLFYKREEWLFNIWFHLIFRYFGYLFCHLILINNCYDIYNIMILTTIYYTHILTSLTLLNISYGYHVYLVSIIVLLLIIFEIY